MNSKNPKGWKMTTLGENLSEKGYIRGPFGSALKRGEMKESGIPVYEQQNAINDHRKFRYFIDQNKYNELKRFTVRPKDIVISCSGTLGKTTVINEHDPVGIISQALLILRVNINKLDPNYLNYFLQSREGQGKLLGASHGSVQVNIARRTEVENISLFLPPIEEQRAITTVLSSVDKKIELLREQNKTLETTAQTIFKEWFVNFNFPGATGKMIDSELGKIPEGWGVGKLRDEVQITMGQSPVGESYNENNLGTIFFQGRTDFGKRFPQIRLYTTEPKRMAKKFDVLVSVRAPVGDINIASDDCCIGRGLAAVSSKYKSYALYRIQSLKESFDKFETEGTVFGSINKDSFSNIEIVIPHNKNIKAFDITVNAIDKKIFNNHIQIQTLATLRDTILPKLINGTLKLKP